MQQKLPFLSQRHYNDGLTDSSGISVSSVTETTDFQQLSAKGRLRLIARQHDEQHGSCQVQDHAFEQQERENFTPVFPRIGFMSKEIEKEKLKMKSDFRLSSLAKVQFPALPAAPTTVGKYRHRAKVIPLLTLPSPSPQEPPFPPPATHLLLKDQFRRERNQQSPGFNEADLARIFDHYSLSRYLSSSESRLEHCRDTPSRSLAFTNNKPLPPLSYNISKKRNKTKNKNRSSRLVWIPRLSQWIPEEQNRPIQYLKFGGGANLNIRSQPICCDYHDFFHKNLNWDAREWKPTVCPRYSYHHHHKQQHSHKKTVPFLHGLDSNKKRKPLTIPRDPFTSKDKRNIKRPWLNEPKPVKATETQQPSIRLVLPHETDDVYPFHWMVDNSTMTEDSSSDVYTIPASFHATPPSIPKSPRQPQQVKKKSKVIMVDKACSVKTSSPASSQGHSYFTEETENKEDLDDFEDVSHASSAVNHDDEEVTDLIQETANNLFSNSVHPTPTSTSHRKEEVTAQEFSEEDETAVEIHSQLELDASSERQNIGNLNVETDAVSWNTVGEVTRLTATTEGHAVDEASDVEESAGKC